MMRLNLLLFLCFSMCLFMGGTISCAQAAQQGGVPATEAFVTDDEFDREFADDFADESGTEKPKALISDPFEDVNRSIFWFNDKLYFYVMKPIARGYRYVVPRPARRSVDNVFSNLAMPIRMVNALLQLKFRDAGVEIYRFVVNSTVGIGGLFDPAGAYTELVEKNEDFGQTLGFYGFDHGFYLVIPVLGPSSLRDAGGILTDSFMGPLRYTDLTFWEYSTLKATEAVNALSLDRDTYEGIVRDSLDPYLFIRAAYVQRRMALVGKRIYNLNVFDDLDDDSESLDFFKWLGQ